MLAQGYESQSIESVLAQYSPNAPQGSEEAKVVYAMNIIKKSQKESKRR
jgi:hypothetical protein